RADILINTIRSIIDGYLISIPKNHQYEIREELLKKKLIYKQEPIALYDIFETFTALDTDIDNFSNIALDWVNAYLDKPIDIKELNFYFDIPKNNPSILPNSKYPVSNINPLGSLEKNTQIFEEKSTFDSESKVD